MSAKPLNYKILGIDPGSLKLGFALIDVKGKKCEVLESGAYIQESKTSFFKRLAGIKNFIDEFICDNGCDFEVSVESLIHVKNVSSLSKLSQARGVILGTLAAAKCDIFEYSPNLIKSSVSGYGHSSKESVEKALKFLFPKHEFKSDDESDALAVAICHSLYRGELSFKKSESSSKKGRGSLKNSFSHLLK